MDGNGTADLALRIERGRPSDAELAVVTAVLYSVLAGRSAEQHSERLVRILKWPSPKAAGIYWSPLSWQHGSRPAAVPVVM